MRWHWVYPGKTIFPPKELPSDYSPTIFDDRLYCEDESKLEIYIGHEKAPAGYIWVFPKGKGDANVGIGVKGAGAKVLLDKFIENHQRAFGSSKIERTLAAPVPVGGEAESYVADNMMLCGDAASQVIPLT